MRKLFAICVCACCGLVEAGTYYKLGTDASGKSSFAGNVSSTVGWGTAKGASSTTAVSDWANSDFIVDGLALRTPAADAAVTFGGRSLTFTGGGYLMLKKANNGGDRHVTVKDLRVTGDGRLSTGQDLSQFTLEGNITLAEDAILGCNFGLSATADDWRYLVLQSTLTGPASSQIAIRGSGVKTKTQSSLLQIENAADFQGTITDTGMAVRNFTLRLAGEFGGSITSLPSETVNVIVNIDGLDPETGLRVLSTTIPAPLLTKLSFYSPTTDVFTAGRKLLTFPKDTLVDPAAFTIKAGWSLTTSTDATLLYLGVVTNADETVSLVTTQGPVLYKIGTDPGGYSSFTTNYSSTVGWATTAGATTTTPFSPDEFAAAECVIDTSSKTARTLRTPTSAAGCTFRPHALRIIGGEVPSDLLFKSANYAVVTIPNLISENAMVGNGNGGYTYTLAGQVTIVDGRRFSVNVVDTGARVIRVESIVRGHAGTELRVTGSGTGSGSAFFTDLSDFRGELQNTAKNMTIDIAGTFAGTVGALDNNPTLRVNFDGLPAGTGLRVTATAIPTTLKTKLRFYSTTQNFLTDGLPLLTFPAGTTVTPSDFTISYCTTADGLASTIPALKVLTGANNEVMLAVDATTPQTARYRKGTGDAYAWHFYGADGSDVTATCGLTEPTASITVLVANTDELAALRALTYTAKTTQLTSFEATADTDLRSDTLPLGTQAGAVIDLKGHKVDFPTTFFSGSTSTPLTPIKNGTFEANAMTSGCYVVMTPQSWTRSGSAALIKNNASFANSQQNSSNWCYLPSGASISQTFELPYASSCTLTFNYAVKNWKGYYTTSYSNVLIDGTNLLTTTGNAYGTTSAYIRKFLAAGKHTLTISCTKGGVSVDNVTLTVQVSSATVTDTVGGGELHINVPEGTTLANAGIVLAGQLKFVKEGAGTFTSARVGQLYTGGTEVVAGKLTTTAGTGSSTDFSAKYNTFGALNSEIVVRRDGTFDIAGNYDYFNYHIILDGGILRSGSASDGPVEQPYGKNQWGGLGWITLTTNSTYYLRSPTVFHGGSAAHPINLGGYELTVDAPIDYKFIYWSTPITNGTLRLKGASKFVREYLEIISAVDARTVDVIDAMGIKMDAMLSVRNYTPIRTWDNTNCTASASLNVYGTFRPDSVYFYGCTLQDGATLDLSGQTEAWSVKSAAKVGRTVVDFANNAKITLQLAGRRTMGRQLVDWEANTPTNLATLAFTLDPVKKAEGYRIYWNEKGIFTRIGTMVIVR